MIIKDERDHNLLSILEPMHIENTHWNNNFEEDLQTQVEI